MATSSTIYHRDDILFHSIRIYVLKHEFLEFPKIPVIFCQINRKKFFDQRNSVCLYKDVLSMVWD